MSHKGDSDIYSATVLLEVLDSSNKDQALHDSFIAIVRVLRTISK